MKPNGQPLVWDEPVEARERRRIVHILNQWIRRFFPHVAIIARRPGRRSVETQLRHRLHFSTEAWQRYGPLPQVIGVLKLIQWELALTNCNFLPGDSVTLLTDSCYGIDDRFLFQQLEKRYAVKYQEEECRRIRHEKWTVGDLVTDLQVRRGNNAQKEQT